MTRWIVLAATLLGSAAAFAQTPYTPIPPLPLGRTLASLPTTQVLPPGAWEVGFTHRFSQPINEGDVHSLWGLDSGSDVGIGVAWSPVRDLDLTLDRSNVEDDLELAAKYRLLSQAPAVPFSISFRGGVDWRTEVGLDHRLSYFGQAILARRVGSNGELFVIPTFATNAGQFSSAANVPFGYAHRLRDGLSLVAELIPANRDLPASDSSDFAWALGLKRALGGHYFEIVLTNSRATHVSQYMAGNFLGPINAGDVRLGFNIERRFGR